MISGYGNGTVWLLKTCIHHSTVGDPAVAAAAAAISPNAT